LKKTILIIGGSIDAAAGIQLAKQMGLHVVVSDMNPHAPGIAYADDYIEASTYDIENTVNAARAYQHRKKRRIDGVTCIAADVPQTVAAVAEAMDLPGISSSAAFLSSNKLEMKRRFAADHIPIPWFSAIHSAEDLHQVARSKNYPLILKPVDNRGSRGVARLIGDIDLNWAFNFALDHSTSKQVMVEQFLSGPQISTESIIIEGNATTPGFSDRNYEYLDTYAPFIVENGGDLPGHLTDHQKGEINDLIGQAAGSIGIFNGIIKGDIVIHLGKPYIIELAARLSGGFFCTHEIPLNSGVNPVKAAIQLALGEDIKIEDFSPVFNRFVSQRYLFSAPGKIVSINNVEQAGELPGISEIILLVREGEIYHQSNPDIIRTAMVISLGDTPDKAKEQANKAVNLIQIKTKPV